MTGGEGRLDLKSGVAATVVEVKSGGYSSLLYTSRSSKSSRS